ncbi:MAG: hypothetical protein ABMA14_18220 [Hyphomonadaceae bacterium]
MQFVCDAPKGRAWFRLETEAEAAAESRLMRHAVEKHYQTAQQRARRSYVPGPGLERDIGLKSHITRTMPIFLTLRADDGAGLATAMLPPGGKWGTDFTIIIVGPENADPYRDHADAIVALAHHFSLELPRSRCFPYASR